MSEMNAIAAAVDKYLSDKGYKYTWNEDKELFVYDVWFPGVIKKVTFIIDIRESDCRSYAIFPIGPDTDDPKMMAGMCELLTRINYLLVNGNFEMDMKDGEIRYKSYLDCEDIIPSRGMITSVINIPKHMVLRFGNAIFDVLTGKKTPAEAMEEAENRSQQFDSRLDTLMAQLMAKAEGDSDTGNSTIDGGLLFEEEDEVADKVTTNESANVAEEGEAAADDNDEEDFSAAALETQFQALLRSMADRVTVPNPEASET